MTSPQVAAESIVDELRAAEDEVVERLLVGVPAAVGGRWAGEMVALCRPGLASVLPALWTALPDGGLVGREPLAAVEGLSRTSQSDGAPMAVPLTAVRSIVARLSSMLVARAGDDRVRAVGPLLSGLAAASHDVSMAVVAPWARPDARSLPSRPSWVESLLPVQRDVLALAAKGWSTEAIALELHYSRQNVSYHLGRMMRRACVSNRTALVASAVRCEGPSPDGG